MIPTQLKELKALIEANGIKRVFITGSGSDFSITINNKYQLANGRGASTIEKTYATLSSLFNFLHKSGLAQHCIEFDITNWTPYVPPAKRPKRKAASKTTTTKTTIKKQIKGAGK